MVDKNKDAERARAWYHANKDRIDKEKKKAYLKEYRLRNMDKWKRTPEQQEVINARRREKYATDPEYREKERQHAREYQKNNPHIRKQQRIRQYNLTLEEFHKMLEDQGGECAICGYDNLSNRNYFPVVDHCHKTGIVRGLLCGNCNHAIGKLKDDPKLLRRAADYLEASHG
jgi:hypothetical protein